MTNVLRDIWRGSETKKLLAMETLLNARGRNQSEVSGGSGGKTVDRQLNSRFAHDTSNAIKELFSKHLKNVRGELGVH